MTTSSGQGLAATIEANMIEQFISLFAPSPRVEIHRDPDVLWVVSDIPHRYLNRVLRAELSPEDVDARIDAILSHFTSRQLPMGWRIGPSTGPAGLAKHLTSRGLTPTEGTTGMAIDLSALDEDLPTPPELRIDPVRDDEALGHWVCLVATGFGYPAPVARVLFDIHAQTGFAQDLPWQLYICSLKGEPVAASRLFLEADVAGIYAVATLPRARRQGIGTAMTLTPLREARSMGYRLGVLHANPVALGLYRQLGFHEYCQFPLYVWHGETDQDDAAGRDA